MTFDDVFLDELRLMFMEGATISRLIRWIANQKPDDASLYECIQDCFFRAFGVGPLRISRKVTLGQIAEEDLCRLNRFVIAEVIKRYSEWGSHLSDRAEPFWKDVPIKSSHQFIEEAHPEDVPELADCWPSLDPRAQQYLRRVLGNLNETFQSVEILARLSERLQGQVLSNSPDAARIEK